MKDKRIFTINPGSTSTKIALFEGDKCLFSENVAHDAGKLKEFKNIVDQFPYREATILDILNKNQIDLIGVKIQTNLMPEDFNPAEMPLLMQKVGMFQLKFSKP